MFTDAVVDLVERGVVTGRRKEVNRGKIVSAFAMGTSRLYAFLHDNGRSIPERVRDLSAIAAPGFRADLLQHARKAHLI
jgi:acyl-CoA hydrolase